MKMPDMIFCFISGISSLYKLFLHLFEKILDTTIIVGFIIVLFNDLGEVFNVKPARVKPVQQVGFVRRLGLHGHRRIELRQQGRNFPHGSRRAYPE